MSCKIHSACLKFSFFAIFLLILQPLQAQKKKDRDTGLEKFPELDAILIRNQKALGNDLVTMVWTDTLVFQKEQGDFDFKTQAPIASASKWLTAALVMIYVDEGLVSLDDHISQYLPIFAKYGKSYITLRHCLTHMTGIQAEGIFPRKKFATLEEEVASYAKKEIQTNPGTEFRYSYIGLNIAARVIEVATKKKFESLIRQKLFHPMQMTKTSFAKADGTAPNPSGGAVSTAGDYMKFLRMLLNNGIYQDKRILSEESIKELRRIQITPDLVKYAPRSAEGFTYALGSWAIEEENGEAVALTSPGLLGMFPVVDWCRGYASLVMMKSLLSEQKKDIYLQMKEAIDEELKSHCGD